MEQPLQHERSVGIVDGLLAAAAADTGQPPYEEDFFQRIVNVSWATGLAVEFLDGAA